MNDTKKSLTTDVALSAPESRYALSVAEFQGLADMPPELEWFASIESDHTRRAYEADIKDFMGFAGITNTLQFRAITRAHVLAWRKVLESRELAPATIRRKMAALASLYSFLTDKNAVEQNPVKGVRRPKVDTYEGKTPALGDHEARALLEAPDTSTIKGLRDRAILSVMLFHALRREEVTKLRVKDWNLNRQGVPHIRVHGKGAKTRFLPTHPATALHITDYLAKAGHAGDLDGALFRAVRNPKGGDKTQGITANGIYNHAVRKYMRQVGLVGELHAPHALRATAATNALSHDADIAKVQEWLGHANIQTTRIYDRRSTKPEDSPTFKVKY
jgi:integrase/recombinase XerD